MPRHERSISNDDDPPKTVRLTENDVQDAARLFRLMSEHLRQAGGFCEQALRPASTRTRQIGTDELISRARIILHGRRLRSRYFNPAIFGEPAWDILLVLYITENAGSRQTVGKIADWIETPLTTVIRWIDYLEKEKLVRREAHPTDRRVVFLRLMDKGWNALEAFLGLIPG